MKNLLIVLAGCLMLSSCGEKKDDAPIAVSGIALQAPSLNLEIGGTYTLKVSFTPENASNKSVEWSSDTPGVATVTDGMVTGVKAGTATITVKSKSNTSIKAECQLNVLPKIVNATALKLNPENASILVNGTLPIATVFTPADATDNLHWTSSKEEVATVSNTGVASGKSAGSATITAVSKTNPAIKAECQLIVTTMPVPVTNLSLTTPTLTLFVGQTHQLEKTIAPKNTTNPGVTFSSDKPEIAAVSETGLVTAKSKGTAIITVTTQDGNKTDHCTVTVNLPVSSITLGPDPAKVAMGSTLQLTFIVLPDDAFNKILTWSSSAPLVVTVSDAGVVTGVTAGSATITATAADGNGATKSLPVIVQSTDASVSAITLGSGAGIFSAPVPAAGSTAIIANAPRSIAADLSVVPVTIHTATHATIKIGASDFTQGQNMNFNSPATFTVTAEDGVSMKQYTLQITVYDAASNPYGIYTAGHLNDVRNNKAGSYKMMNNIILPARNEEGNAATGIADYAVAGWLPIADDATANFGAKPPTAENGFTGTFDGGNFAIDNFYIKRNTNYIGLFGITFGATLKNIGIIGVESPALTGFQRVGAIAGGTIQGSVSNCYASADVHLLSNWTGFTFIGGIVGKAAGTNYSTSYSSGNISGNLTGQGTMCIGGFAGDLTNVTISDCYATGNITATAGNAVIGGGMAGYFFTAKAVNCYATGDVAATANSSKIGGLGNTDPSLTYIKCYRNSSAVLTKSGQGNTAIDFLTTGIIPKTKEEMQADTFIDLLSPVWGHDSRNNKLPYIKGVGIGK